MFPSFSSCLVKITGDLTMSFPAGITRIFTANPNVPVLSFRLVNISRIDNFLPNQKLLYRSAALCLSQPHNPVRIQSLLTSCNPLRLHSDPSQSDPDTRDFWFNMQALQLYLQREAELNPQASYYNVGLLKYQVRDKDEDSHHPTQIFSASLFLFIPTFSLRCHAWCKLKLQYKRFILQVCNFRIVS